MSEAPLLRLTSLSKSFGAVEAVVNFSLELHRHEIVALVGDNAAGKSTIARMISGDYLPSSGSIEIDGNPVNITSTHSAFAHGIATVFQELALCPNLDVTANIFLGRELRSIDGLLNENLMERCARQYLDHLGSKIPDVHAPLSSLSGGQRQCVAIARTLVANPKIVILDEPTASLSVAQTADVLTYIEHLRSLGLGIILISHNLADVLAISDRVVVLRHGQLNGIFHSVSVSYEEIIAAMTGATRYRQYPLLDLPKNPMLPSKESRFSPL